MRRRGKVITPLCSLSCNLFGQTIYNAGMLQVHLSSLTEKALKFTEMKTGLDRNYCLSFTERFACVKKGNVRMKNY